MPRDSLKRRRSVCLSEAEEKYGISGGDVEKLMIQFRAVFQKLGVKQKYRIMGRLVKEKTAEGVTWSGVSAAIEMDKKIHKIIGVIKRGGLVSQLGELRELKDVDFRDYGIGECETSIKEGIRNSLEFGQMRFALEIASVFGTCIDLTPEIKSAYQNCVADKMSGTADAIRQMFPEIDFDS